MPSKRISINEIDVSAYNRRSFRYHRNIQRRIKDVWKAYLDTFSPKGISSSGVNDINDAYRHYMSASELTRLFGPEITFTLGDLNEIVNNTYSIESTKMDYANNDAGIEAGKNSESGFESSLHFMSDLIQGRIRVIDKKTRKIRETTVHDLPEQHDGDALENRYRPDRGGGRGIDDMSGHHTGTMVA